MTDSSGAQTVNEQSSEHVCISMTFEEVKTCLKQRFPMLMVDRVLALEPGKRITTLKNITGNEIQFLGHFSDYAIMPGTLIIEAIGQSASLLFSHTSGKGVAYKEFMALASVNDIRFLVPVLPGHVMMMEITILKMTDQAALIEGIARVDNTIVARGKLSFARMTV